MNKDRRISSLESELSDLKTRLIAFEKHVDRLFDSGPELLEIVKEVKVDVQEALARIKT